MIREELPIIERLLIGYWPNPAPSDDELAVWERSLFPCDFDTACEVIEAIAATGKQYRPNPGEFIAAYRQRRARPGVYSPEAVAVAQLEEHTYEPGSHPARVAAVKTVPEKVAILREQIAALPKNSPLKAAFKKVLP